MHFSLFTLLSVCPLLYLVHSSVWIEKGEASASRIPQIKRPGGPDLSLGKSTHVMPCRKRGIFGSGGAFFRKAGIDTPVFTTEVALTCSSNATPKTFDLARSLQISYLIKRMLAKWVAFDPKERFESTLQLQRQLKQTEKLQVPPEIYCIVTDT